MEEIKNLAFGNTVQTCAISVAPLGTADKQLEQTGNEGRHLSESEKDGIELSEQLNKSLFNPDHDEVHVIKMMNDETPFSELENGLRPLEDSGQGSSEKLEKTESILEEFIDKNLVVDLKQKGAVCKKVLDCREFKKSNKETNEDYDCRVQPETTRHIPSRDINVSHKNVADQDDNGISIRESKQSTNSDNDNGIFKGHDFSLNRLSVITRFLKLAEPSGLGYALTSDNGFGTCSHKPLHFGVKIVSDNSNHPKPVESFETSTISPLSSFQNSILQFDDDLPKENQGGTISQLYADEKVASPRNSHALNYHLQTRDSPNETSIANVTSQYENISYSPQSQNTNFHQNPCIPISPEPPDSVKRKLRGKLLSKKAHQVSKRFRPYSPVYQQSLPNLPEFEKDIDQAYKIWSGKEK